MNSIKLKEKTNKLLKEDIENFISTLNNRSDEEITKWLKSVKEFGLDDDETSSLTLAMARSGEILAWEGLEPTIDKHSTGGIGDKITLLFVPLIAAYGINTPKLSGRGLGITGGTIDKLESIAGFRTDLNLEEIKSQVKKIGLVITGAMKNLAPADKRLYAIRDVTNTVDSIPLIASSVMSKKIACGSKNIILDVKFGSGAFMKDKNSANELALKMVSIGKNLNRNIKAILTNMDQPLGYNIGNSLEIIEILEVLSGKDILDLTEITILLAKEAISSIGGKINPDLEDKLYKLLLNGSALKKFEEMIMAQGGDLNFNFPKSNFTELITSNEDGYIKNIDALSVGEVVHSLGAGRNKVSDLIDHSVGIKLFKKPGNKVLKGEPLFEIYAKSKNDANLYSTKVKQSIEITQKKSDKLKLIEEVIK